MRDINRIYPMLLRIANAWRILPNMRFSQLFIEAIGLESICEIEDEEVVRRIEEYAKNNKEKILHNDRI